MTCIPRKDMPQVDNVNIQGLIAFLRSQGVEVREELVPLPLLRTIQCPEEIRPTTHPEILAKPLLVSIEPIILDGNHRYALMRKELVTEARCLRIMAPFEVSKASILRFPSTYRYGDGAFHPYSW